MKNKHECKCTPVALLYYAKISDGIKDAVRSVSDAVSKVTSWFGSILGNDNAQTETAKQEPKKLIDGVLCNCCKEDTGNCLKDGYKCGISHVMKYFFGCENCNCVGITTETSGTNGDEKKHKADITDGDKLCKC